MMPIQFSPSIRTEIGLPQESFTLALGLHRQYHKLLKPSFVNVWGVGNAAQYPYCENDFLASYKGQTITQFGDKWIINGNPAKYFIPVNGGLLFVNGDIMRIHYRPPTSNQELTSVLAYIVEPASNQFENHSFFQYVDWLARESQNEKKLYMSSYGLQWIIEQDCNSINGKESYPSIKTTRSGINGWANDSIGMRYGINVVPVNPSSLVNGVPKWVENTVKIRNDRSANLVLQLTTGHENTVFRYTKEIQ